MDAWPARAGLAGEGHCGEIRDDAERGVARLSRQDMEARADLLAWIEQWLAGNPPPNVWIGATIVNQAEADRDIPKLLDVPARVRFLSMEPLLGPVDLTHIEVFGGDAEIFPLKGTTDCVDDEGAPTDDVPALDWVIVGGESGPGARPMSPDWARSLRDQCAAAGVPFLFKQWGEWIPMLDQAEGVPVREMTTTPDGWVMGHAGKKAAGRLLDGRTWDGFPTA